MTRKSRREGGLSFIDVMLSLVVLTFGVLAMADLQFISSSGNKASQGLTTAASLGGAKLEALKKPCANNIVAEAPVLVDESGSPPQVGYNGPTFTRTVTVTNNSPMINTKTVTVTMTWTEGSKTHTIPVSTIIAQ